MLEIICLKMGFITKKLSITPGLCIAKMHTADSNKVQIVLRE
jgi:hypothetical protein